MDNNGGNVEIIGDNISDFRLRRTKQSRNSLTDQAYERIRGEILDRTLLPDTTLVEGALAQRYKMSKTPIREALYALARAGLVNDSARGWRVRLMDKSDAAEIYRLREVLEPLALRTSFPLLTAEDKQVLRHNIAEVRAAITTRDLPRLIAANSSFHYALFARAGNSRIVEILRRLQDQLKVIRIEIWTSDIEYLHWVDQHAALVDAIEAGEIDRAAMMLHDHIREFRIKHIDGK
jgi:DNA-binding GntR family transcriptional regulator